MIKTILHSLTDQEMKSLRRRASMLAKSGADDLLQDSYVKALELAAAGKFRGQSKVSTFVNGVIGGVYSNKRIVEHGSAARCGRMHLRTEYASQVKNQRKNAVNSWRS